MKASERAKAAGLNGLKEPAEMTGKDQSTLIRWNKTQPEFLDIIFLGCWHMKKKAQESK